MTFVDADMWEDMFIDCPPAFSTGKRNTNATNSMFDAFKTFK